MSEEFGSNFITLTDEDGQEIVLEHLDTIEYNGEMYMAFFPADEADDEGNPPAEDEEEEGELIILKAVVVDGEDQLATLESEEELQAVYEKFMEELFEDEE